MRDIVRLLGKDIPALPTPQFEIRDSGPPATEAGREERGWGQHAHTHRGRGQQGGQGGGHHGGQRPGTQRQSGGARPAAVAPGRATGPQSAARSFKPRRSSSR